MQHALPFLRRDSDVVNGLSVQVSDALDPGEFFELSNGADGDDLRGMRQSGQGKLERTTHLFVIIADPKWDRSSPVSIPRDVPVSGIREPVAESIVADSLGYPRRTLSVRNDRETEKWKGITILSPRCLQPACRWLKSRGQTIRGWPCREAVSPIANRRDTDARWWIEQ